jgi:hypothetical protein
LGRGRVDAGLPGDPQDQDNEKRRQVEQFAIDSVWDVDDTDDATLRAPAAENLH